MGDQIVVRVDASIVANTGELASLLLRPGNAAPNNAMDLVTVTDEAISQIPAPYRKRLLVTCDTAGASHDLIGWLDELNRSDNAMAVQYWIGWDITAEVRAAIGMLAPECWTPALDAYTGAPRALLYEGGVVPRPRSGDRGRAAPVRGGAAGRVARQGRLPAPRAGDDRDADPPYRRHGRLR